MALLARGRRLAYFCALTLLACTTYSDLQSAAGVSGAGAMTAGTQAEAGKDPGTGGKPSAGSGSTPVPSGSSTGGTSDTGGQADLGGAGAAACVDDDCCPEDTEKTEPGACGCGVADADSDADGALDCEDACPSDPEKTEPGECGCGLPEADTAELASCHGLVAAMVHRYDFEGGGTLVKDRVGSADGSIEGLAEQSVVSGKGVLQLVGNAAYVNLPNFLISKLSSVSIECWLTWNGGKAWQRVFDFGESTAMPPEGAQKEGKDYLFMTPMAVGSGARLGFSLNGPNNESAATLATPLGTGVTHLLAVVDTDANKMQLYRDGSKGAEAAFTAALSSINDVNVWLGRSQYGNDPAFTGTFHEFRIYDKALSAKEVAASFVAGPDPSFLATN